MGGELTTIDGDRLPDYATCRSEIHDPLIIEAGTCDEGTDSPLELTHIVRHILGDELDALLAQLHATLRHTVLEDLAPKL